MPRKQRIKSNSGFYHIMLRGNERKNIFKSDEDKLRFMETIREKKDKDRFCLHAFCLMDNHVHLMLSEGTEDISTVIKRITVSYVYYFNKKYKRVGHLFQDRFKSEAVENDRYILALARYIHQNPVKAGLVEKVSDYKWSSYNCYLDCHSSSFSEILDTNIILDLFSENRYVAIERFKIFMHEECEDTFIDLEEMEEVMDEAEAKKLFQKMIIDHGLKNMVYGFKRKNNPKVQIPDGLIREFREKTNLPIRRIAAITGLNKDKVNRILKSKI